MWESRQEILSPNPDPEGMVTDPREGPPTSPLEEELFCEMLFQGVVLCIDQITISKFYVNSFFDKSYAIYMVKRSMGEQIRDFFNPNPNPCIMGPDPHF